MLRLWGSIYFGTPEEWGQVPPPAKLRVCVKVVLTLVSALLCLGAGAVFLIMSQVMALAVLLLVAGGVVLGLGVWDARRTVRGYNREEQDTDAKNPRQ